jgi:hypothetical protein
VADHWLLQCHHCRALTPPALHPAMSHEKETGRRKWLTSSVLK